MADPIRIIFTDENLMVRWPSGRVQFIEGFWSMIRLAWHISTNGFSYVIEDNRHA